MTTEEAVDTEHCHVCGVGDDGRRLCHFVPNDECPEEIYLHVFCGKTAAILPHVNRPDLEILTKAGVKNKHGTGVSVTLALQRCRSSRVNDPSNREQEYYLSKEFERIYLAVTKEPAHAEEDDDHLNNLEELSNLQPQTVPNPMYTTDFAGGEPQGGQVVVSPENEHADEPPAKRHKADDNLPKSPYDIEMERLQLVCDRCSGVGYSLIRGVARSPSEAPPMVAVVDDEGNQQEAITENADNTINDATDAPDATTADDEDNFDPTKCSQEQVDHVRVIVITKERQDRMEEMSKLILGEQHGQELMTFSTSFAYQVINAWNAFTVRFHEAGDGSWEEKFDLLLGFTDTLKEHDVWMHDHEDGWGGEKMVRQLALSWKLVLKRDNEELGIDSEYTRPGIAALLDQFKEAVERVETQNISEAMTFDFNCVQSEQV